MSIAALVSFIRHTTRARRVSFSSPVHYDYKLGVKYAHSHAHFLSPYNFGTTLTLLLRGLDYISCLSCQRKTQFVTFHVLVYEYIHLLTRMLAGKVRWRGSALFIIRSACVYILL